MSAAKKKSSLSMSDAAVKAKTGKTWAQWFAALDKAGGKKMTHQQIVAVLSRKHGVGPWWQQMVTVEYERARGLRLKHQTAAGFSISRSKTMLTPVADLYKAWTDPKQRRKWLANTDFTVRKATANKSIRITWIDGKTNVEVMFYPKPAGKCQVTIQHNKLADAKTVDKLKKYWGEKLDRLQSMIEGS